VVQVGREHQVLLTGEQVVVVSGSSWTQAATLTQGHGQGTSTGRVW
jgi:hypothetical protein